MPRVVAHPLLVCIAAVFSYAPLGVAAEVGEEPAPACPAPKVEQTEWRSVELVRIGIRLNMPKKYGEKHWAVSVGNPVVATFRASHVEDFTLQLEAPEGRPLGEHKVGRQNSYEGYTECPETISGRQAIIQSFREPHVIFMDRWYPAFAVHAVYDLRPGHILRFDGSAATPQGQEELLAIVRTLKFTR
jgi:hypothetical protein